MVRFGLTSDMISTLGFRGHFVAPEQSMIDWAKQFLQPGKLFVDIGAHVGTYALQYAAAGYDVVAFEARKDTFMALNLGVGINGLLDRVTTYNVALSRSIGTSELRGMGADGGDGTILPLSTHTQPRLTFPEIPTRTLDSMELRNIGFIKIDVEGAENDVLIGAKETLERSDFPNIIFESWRPSRMPEAAKLRSELFATLGILGYEIVPIRGWDEMYLAVQGNRS